MVRYSDIYDKLSGDRPEERPDQTGAASDETPSARQPLRGEPSTESAAEPVDVSAESLSGRGVSDAERSVLGELTGLDLGVGGDVDEPTAGEPSGPDSSESEAAPEDEDDGMFAELDAAIEESPSAPEPPRSGSLTKAEVDVRQAVLEESHRVAREELPSMFPGARGRLTGLEAAYVVERPDGIEAASGGPEGLSARVVEVLNLPARWLGPAVVTGLGLAGIFLLIALLVVVLVGVLSG